MTKHDVEIELTGHGRGEVLLDGKPVPLVTRVEIVSAVGEANIVAITLIAEKVRFTGPAAVRTLVEAPSYFEFNARRAMRPHPRPRRTSPC